MDAVLVTGVGAVTPLGVGARALHERWVAGECGVRDGEAPCSDAGWDGELPYAPGRVGCVLGTGVGGITTLVNGQDTLRERGAEYVSPLSVPLMMANAGAAALSMRHGLQGPTFAVSTACASGAHALGCALRMLQSGEADAV